MAYDRADFDYSTPEHPLPPGHAATHIGMFLAWAVQNGLENDIHRANSTAFLEQLKARSITGREFFQSACGEKFAEKDLNPEGNAFASWYYRNDAGEQGPYFQDYKKALCGGLPSFWHVSDTWQNFDVLWPVLQERYEHWKKPPPRKWWQFWK